MLGWLLKLTYKLLHHLLSLIWIYKVYSKKLSFYTNRGLLPTILKCLALQEPAHTQWGNEHSNYTNTLPSHHGPRIWLLLAHGFPIWLQKKYKKCTSQDLSSKDIWSEPLPHVCLVEHQGQKTLWLRCNCVTVHLFQGGGGQTQAPELWNAREGSSWHSVHFHKNRYLEHHSDPIGQFSPNRKHMSYWLQPLASRRPTAWSILAP